MMKKADIILAAVLLILSFALIGVSAFSGEGETVCVTVDGVEYKTYPLSGNFRETIETPYGVNTLVIRDKKASVIDADCPDKYCVSHVEIDKEGQTIVCLPHRLVVEITGDGHG